MIIYKEFIRKMEEKGYTYVNGEPIVIDEYDSMVNIFPVKKGSVTKILELQCPNNSIIAMCGTEHNGGCHNTYVCNMKCTDDKGEQPFQKKHYASALNLHKHVVAEIVVTKILLQDPPLDNKKVQEWSETSTNIKKLIGSYSIRDHIMWIGAYPKFNSDFIKTSFTLYGGQKMTFYLNNPDIDIDNVKLNISLDIFEKLT